MSTMPSGPWFWLIVILALVVGVLLAAAAFYRIGTTLIVVAFVAVSLSDSIAGRFVRASGGAFVVGVAAFATSGYHYWAKHI